MCRAFISIGIAYILTFIGLIYYDFQFYYIVTPTIMIIGFIFIFMSKNKENTLYVFGVSVLTSFIILVLFNNLLLYKFNGFFGCVVRTNGIYIDESTLQAIIILNYFFVSLAVFSYYGDIKD